MGGGVRDTRAGRRKFKWGQLVWEKVWMTFLASIREVSRGKVGRVIREGGTVHQMNNNTSTIRRSMLCLLTTSTNTTTLYQFRTRLEGVKIGGRGP